MIQTRVRPSPTFENFLVSKQIRFYRCFHRENTVEGRFDYIGYAGSQPQRCEYDFASVSFTQLRLLIRLAFNNEKQRGSIEILADRLKHATRFAITAGVHRSGKEPNQTIITVSSVVDKDQLGDDVWRHFDIKLYEGRNGHPITIHVYVSECQVAAKAGKVPMGEPPRRFYYQIRAVTQRYDVPSTNNEWAGLGVFGDILPRGTKPSLPLHIPGVAVSQAVDKLMDQLATYFTPTSRPFADTQPKVCTN